MSLDVKGPTTVFMMWHVWERDSAKFRELHTVDSVSKVVPSGALIAVEVGGPKTP